MFLAPHVVQLQGLVVLVLLTGTRSARALPLHKAVDAIRLAENIVVPELVKRLVTEGVAKSGKDAVTKQAKKQMFKFAGGALISLIVGVIVFVILLVVVGWLIWQKCPNKPENTAGQAASIPVPCSHSS